MILYHSHTTVGLSLDTSKLFIPIYKFAYVPNGDLDPNSLMTKFRNFSRSYGILSGIHRVWVLWAISTT